MRKLLFILVIVLSACRAQGQTYSFNAQADGSLTVLPVVFLSLTTVGSTPSFTTEADYNNGITSATWANAYIKANISWIISVKAQSANFTPLTTGASTTMPCSVIQLKKSTNSSYVTLSTADQTLCTGPLGDNLVSGNTFNVSMTFNPGWGYAGGSYRMNVIYTAVQQ